MTKTTNTKAPPLAAYHVSAPRKGDEKGFWTRIGAAWPHQDGEGFTLRLDLYPIDGRIVIRPFKAEGQQEGVA